MGYIEVKNLVKKYKKQTVIDSISFNLESGDILGIIGENGAGKSTLMSMLVTLIKPSEGDIVYKGDSIVAMPDKLRGHVGYVPQDIALYEDLSGIDNIKFWAKTYHIPKEAMNERITSIKEIIGLDEDVLLKKVKTYSGGMKRRLNIGVALLNEPELIVMDEPTVGIDIASKAYILSVIKKLGEEGKTIIYASHDLDDIQELCNKVCILNRGDIIDFTEVSKIKEYEGTFRQYYLEKHRSLAT